MRRAILAAALLAPMAAGAEQFDVPWFVQHRSDLALALQTCENDVRFADTPTCRNAELAAARVWSQRIGHGRTVTLSPSDPMSNVDWWLAHPINLRAVKQQCIRMNGPGDEMQRPYCAVVMKADAIARRRG